MSDFKVTPEVQLSIAQMLERYQLEDESILRRWAKLHGINSSRGFYYPTEVDLIDHVHHHIYNLGMSIADYQNLLDRRRTNNTNNSQPVTEANTTIANQVADEAYNAIEMLTEQYSEAIDLMGERIADHFVDELDLSVMRHLAKKVQDRRKLNGQGKPNRFLQVIKAVLQPSGNTLLVPKNPDQSSLELEHNHRLG
jgi:DNA-binding transcriptional MerR regulator